MTKSLIIGVFVLLVCVLASAQTITLNESSTYPAEHIGINVGNCDYYESYLLSDINGCTNGGMQPKFVRAIIAVVASGNSTTTFKDNNAFTGYAANIFAGGTFQVLCHGNNNPAGTQSCLGGAGPTVASVIPGTAGSLGCTGTIASNTAADGSSNGAIFTVSSPCAASFASQDTVIVTSAIAATSLANVTWQKFGWNYLTTGTGTVTVDATPADQLDLYGSGVQPTFQVFQLAVSDNSSSAQMQKYFDSGFQEYLLNGNYQACLYANIVSGGNATLNVNVSRPGDSTATATVNINLTPTGTGWAQYCGTATAANPESYPGNYAPTSTPITTKLTLTTSTGAATVRVAAFSFKTAVDSANGTQFTTQAINKISTLNPGECRWWGSQGPDVLDNMIAPLYSRRSATINYDGAGSQIPQVQIGLYDFLIAAKSAGCHRVSIVVPSTAVWNEAPNYSDFLFGSSGTTYGAKRVALGHPTSFANDFASLTLEYGNEVWNNGTFGNGSMQVYTCTSGQACWNYSVLAPQFCGALKQTASWPANAFCGVSAWTGVPFWTQQTKALDPNGYIDLYMANEYGAFNITTCTTPQMWTSAWTEAYSNVTDTASASGFYQTAGYAGTGGGSSHMAIYEYQNSTDSGSCTQAQLTGYPEGEGYALTDVLMPALANQKFGVIHSNFFTLIQNSFGISTTGGATSVKDWGIYNGSGGQYNNLRPAGYALAAYNNCVGTGYTGYAATVGSGVTYNFAGYNGVNAISNVPYLQSFAFKSGTNRCVAIFNTDPTNSYTVGFAGNNTPTGTVTTTTLYSANLTDANETPWTADAITTTTATVTNPTSIVVQPHSMVTLAYSVAATGVGPTVIGGGLVISGAVAVK